MSPARAYRAGESLEDYCRACKTDRQHTVVAADPQGQPIRVVCGFCGSEHNYRGGPRITTQSAVAQGASRAVAQGASRAVAQGFSPVSTPSAAAPRRAAQEQAGREPFPIVSDRERVAPAMASDASVDLELLIRRVIREECGITAVTPAEKWRGGSLVLRPGTPGLQEKSLPIETFFHKIVMLRNRLRSLEQQVNAAELPEDVKVKLQGYVTGCYGSLTSFNVLFADEDDQFKGAGES
jgi:hypothetical protein